MSANVRDPISSRARGPARSTEDLPIEVIVLWGECVQTQERNPDVLHVAYVSSETGFSVGDEEATDKVPAPDYLIDHAQLGATRLSLVARDERDPNTTLLIVPLGASIQTVSEQGQVRSASDLVLDGSLRSSTNPAYPLAWQITRGSTAWLSYRGFTFVVRTTPAAEKIAVAPRPDWEGQRFTFVSLAAHLFLLALFYYSPPKSSAMTSDSSSMRAAYLDYTITAPEVEIEPMPTFEDEGAEGSAAAEGEVGTLGEDTAKPVKAKKTTQASPRSPTPSAEPPLTREQWADIARKSGIIQALNGAVPTLEGRFTSTAASGMDAASAIASILGDTEGASFGNGLSEMVGPGRGGGGFAKGTIGSGPLGTIGRGPGGNGTGKYGEGVGNRLGPYKGHGPRIRPSTPQIVGSLSKEVIRRTIQRHTNEVRFCYEQALQAKPDLQGRVAVRFIIGPTGAVQFAGVASSDLNQASVDQCITNAVKRWIFPQPEGSGIVSVTYPFVLEQVGG